MLVPHLRHYFDYASSFDIGVLDVGTNDLSLRSSPTSPTLLAQEGVAFVENLICHLMVKVVIILDVIDRNQDGRYFMPHHFSNCLYSYNGELRSLANPSPLPIRIWTIPGFARDVLHHLARDGTHLSTTIRGGRRHSAMFKYVVSLKQALVKGLGTTQNSNLLLVFKDILAHGWPHWVFKIVT